MLASDRDNPVCQRAYVNIRVVKDGDTLNLFSASRPLMVLLNVGFFKSGYTCPGCVSC
jgi:hypothetical protein